RKQRSSCTRCAASCSRLRKPNAARSGRVASDSPTAVAGSPFYPLAQTVSAVRKTVTGSLCTKHVRVAEQDLLDPPRIIAQCEPNRPYIDLFLKCARTVRNWARRRNHAVHLENSIPRLER